MWTKLILRLPIASGNYFVILIHCLRGKVNFWTHFHNSVKQRQILTKFCIKNVTSIFKDWQLCYQTIFSNETLCIFYSILLNQVHKIWTGYVQISHFCGTLCWVYFFQQSVYRMTYRRNAGLWIVDLQVLLLFVQLSTTNTQGRKKRSADSHRCAFKYVSVTMNLHVLF